jgi:hypothetical protein
MNGYGGGDAGDVTDFGGWVVVVVCTYSISLRDGERQQTDVDRGQHAMPQNTNILR